MSGAEGAARVDLDRPLGDDAAPVVAAMNDETPCPHGRKRLLRFADPVCVRYRLDRD